MEDRTIIQINGEVIDAKNYILMAKGSEGTAMRVNASWATILETIAELAAVIPQPIRKIFFCETPLKIINFIFGVKEEPETHE